jgi:hypothetical protein
MLSFFRIASFQVCSTASIGSAAGSPSSAAANFGSLADPSAGLQLFVDLSFYPLQQLPSSESSTPRSTTRHHSMVLRPWLPKTALLIVSATFSTAPISRVMSSSTFELIAFSDADRYEAWYGAMRDEIQALRSNNTWSLVPFHPSMNVVGSRWVYKIKHHVDGSIERYKAHLVARGFT